MTTFATRTIGSSAADAALEEILREIAVPMPVLEEAKRRRKLVLGIAMEHGAARAAYVSGSVAHGTHNKPLEDTDCGIKVNRRFEALRMFGPDAPGQGRGPEGFIQLFADFIVPRLRERGYPDAYVDLSGNRAIKFEFNEQIEIDDWGPVDPYVDLIVGLARADGGGLWIPDRRRKWWDAADPEHHTWLMTKRDPKPLRVHRAHLLRLSKRAVKRDDLTPGKVKVMCSWNLSALGLELVDDHRPLAEGLIEFLSDASASIAGGLTEDPSSVVDEPIKLPDGVTCGVAARRLGEMAEILEAAGAANSRAGARAHLAQLFGQEIDAIRSRDKQQLNRGLRNRDGTAMSSALGLPHAMKPTRSDGA